MRSIAQYNTLFYHLLLSEVHTLSRMIYGTVIFCENYEKKNVDFRALILIICELGEVDFNVYHLMHVHTDCTLEI